MEYKNVNATKKKKIITTRLGGGKVWASRMRLATKDVHWPQVLRPGSDPLLPVQLSSRHIWLNMALLDIWSTKPHSVLLLASLPKDTEILA